MSEAEEAKLNIKFMINKGKTKVLFAEAGSDFTDVLLSFLLLPLGTIMKVLEKNYGDEAPVIGSLNTLYKGVANLDSIHFENTADRLLNPRISYDKDYLCKLRFNVVDNTQHTSPSYEKTCNGAFTQSAASFIISDDLQVMPIVAGSIMKTLSNLGIAVSDMDGAESRNVTLGFNEIIALLRGSLVSQNPLSVLLLGRSQMNLAKANTLLNQIDEKAASTNTKKMVLKVMIQKSTHKLVFAQADHDFVNFLFGLLTVPLGRGEWYLGSNSGLKNVDNLHRSIADNLGKHLRSQHINDWLIKPAVYIYSYYDESSNEFVTLNFDDNTNQKHVKGSRMYMVSDDLTVAPLAITSSLSVLNGLNISLSDVQELELEVGLDDGLSILKAALTSTTALTDGLIKPFLKASLSEKSALSEVLVGEALKKRPKLECL